MAVAVADAQEAGAQLERASRPDARRSRSMCRSIAKMVCGAPKPRNAPLGGVLVATARASDPHDVAAVRPGRVDQPRESTTGLTASRRRRRPSRTRSPCARSGRRGRRRCVMRDEAGWRLVVASMSSCAVVDHLDRPPATSSPAAPRAPASIDGYSSLPPKPPPVTAWMMLHLVAGSPKSDSGAPCARSTGTAASRRRAPRRVASTHGDHRPWARCTSAPGGPIRYVPSMTSAAPANAASSSSSVSMSKWAEDLAVQPRIEDRLEWLGAQLHVADCLAQERPVVLRPDEGDRLGVVAASRPTAQDRLVVLDIVLTDVRAGNVGGRDHHDPRPVEPRIELHADQPGARLGRADRLAVPGAGKDEVVGVQGRAGQLADPRAGTARGQPMVESAFRGSFECRHPCAMLTVGRGVPGLRNRACDAGNGRRGVAFGRMPAGPSPTLPDQPPFNLRARILTPLAAGGHRFEPTAC